MASDIVSSYDGSAMTSHLAPQPRRLEQEYLPQLPSHRYKYSQWHELRDNTVKGHELRAPRVRQGPEVKEAVFFGLRDEQDRRIHHGLRGRKRLDYRHTTESWEQLAEANLSMQELQHDYQKRELKRILRRLTSAQQVVVPDDLLVDLSDVTLPECRVLNLARNYLASFRALPRAPLLLHLNMADNCVTSVEGISALPATLETLDLRGNPVAFTPHYRQRVFSALPNLRELDDIQRREVDEVPLPQDPASCVLL